MDRLCDRVDQMFRGACPSLLCVVDGVDRLWSLVGDDGVDAFWRRIRSVAIRCQVPATVMVVLNQSEDGDDSMFHRYGITADYTWDVAALASGPSRDADAVMTVTRRDDLEQLAIVTTFLVKFSDSTPMVTCWELGGG